MFDRDGLIAACKAHGTVARVVVVRVHGSTPREPGAAMLVWESGQCGTIGGGALEFELARRARSLTSDAYSQHALGPEMGQCCGGVVDVLSEVYDLRRAQALPKDVIARGPDPMPLSVKRMMKVARNQGKLPPTQLCDGWLIEPTRPADRDLWIWGAGHVGRALVDVLQHIPGYRLTWVDTAANRFPSSIPATVRDVVATDPARLMAHAPTHANHLILTYSHEMDLALCHAALAHGFGSCGLIGSRTKWARFRKRLATLGHTETQISRITCPIGDPSLGKEPHMIALGVAHQFAEMRLDSRAIREARA